MLPYFSARFVPDLAFKTAISPSAILRYVDSPGTRLSAIFMCCVEGSSALLLLGTSFLGVTVGHDVSGNVYVSLFFF